MRFKKFCSSIFFALLLLPAFSQTPLQKKIIELMEVMGATAQFELVVDNMINLQKQSYAEIIPNEFWDEFDKEVKKDGFNDLYEMIIPIYEKHFTEEDVDGIIAFYKSEVGLKMVSKQPMIMQEAMTAGAEWGKSIGQDIAMKLENSSAVKFETKLEDCEMYKKGQFKEEFEDGSTAEYMRKGNTQIEIHGGNTTTWDIEWLSDCQYQLVNTKDEELKGQPAVLFTIYEHTETGYKYVGHRPGENYYLEGEIEKMK